MSLFQCEHCGCCENTACSCQGFRGIAEIFDWTSIEERKGKLICSACGPTKYRNGEPSEYGVWHGEFTRTFLPMGEFKTNRVGNLEHIKTGDTCYPKFAIKRKP